MFKQRIKAVYVLIFALLIGYFVYASQVAGSWAGFHPFHLGLDLSGGTHLVYSADVSKLSGDDITSSMASLRDVVERRVNTLGVSEPIVQTQLGGALAGQGNAYKLIVELPGITDSDQAAAEIGKTPVLEFRLATAADLKAFQSSTTILSQSTTTQAAGFTALFKNTGLTGAMVSRASVQFNSTTNAPQVGLQFTSEGAKLFGDITKNNIGNYIGIFLDNNLVSYPVVQSEITGGQAQITGTFTLDQVQKIVRDLNFGALPVPIALISTQTVGPSLGQAAVHGGIYAGIVAFIIISIFLVLWYRLPGFIAVVALGVYTALMLALFKMIPVTLSAAGIAGFIITIGMAVDANILIFERMKEELRTGRGISDAMHEGFARAWTSIRDSNISSIITGVILYYFGSTAIITGFALVFVVGVLVSMFTAITASRLFLYAVAPRQTTRLSTFLISNGFTKLNK
ncbi:MAG TPA: protein translocase subunit SecD [Candidatus Paceibacterota bacterium]|jgi:protein-export membrane protein SecD|nr:protein translocase subunit SecD [Candidatus Paceibacterota bacterium]